MGWVRELVEATTTPMRWLVLIVILSLGAAVIVKVLLFGCFEMFGVNTCRPIPPAPIKLPLKVCALRDLKVKAGVTFELITTALNDDPMSCREILRGKIPKDRPDREFEWVLGCKSEQDDFEFGQVMSLGTGSVTKMPPSNDCNWKKK